MRTFLVDRVIDSEQSEGEIVPILYFNSDYERAQEKYHVEARIRSFELKTLASGQIVTVVHVDPIEFGGKLITGLYEFVDFCPVLKKDDRLLLYGNSEMQERGERQNKFFLRGSFSAYLLDSVGSYQSSKLSRPRKCPSCKSKLFRAEDDVLRCYNSSCPASLAASIVYWRAWAARRNALEFIDHDFAVELIESGLVNSIADLYRLEIGQLTETLNLTKIQARSIFLALEDSKQRSWLWLLKRLCTRGVGCKARMLIDNFSSFEEVSEASVEQIRQAVYCKSTAQSISYWFRLESNQELVRQLRELGLTTSTPLKPKNKNSQELLDLIQHNIIQPLSDSLSALWSEFRVKLQKDEKKFSQYDETFEKIEAQLSQYEKLLLEKFENLLKKEDLEAILQKNLFDRNDSFKRGLDDLTEQYYQIQLDLQAIRSSLKNIDNPLTSEELKKYQTQEAKRQQPQLEKIEKTLDKQLEETRRKLQQFVTSSVQNITRESAKVSDLEVILQLIDEVPGKIEEQLKLEPKLKITSDELSKLTKDLASCKNSLQQQITDLITQLLPELETLQAKQNESSQAILSRFQTQDETLLGAIQTQQVEILPRFETVEKQLTAIVGQNARLNEQFAKEQSQLQLERQNLQAQNDRLQSEIQQSLKEHRILAETLSERSQLLEEASHQLTILSQDLSPAIQLVIERLDQFQPDNTSPEALDVFLQLTTQIHQANKQLQAVRPVAAPLIDELRQENAELWKEVQQTEEQRDRLRGALDSTNTELSRAQLTSDRLNREQSGLEYNLSDTRTQLKIARDQQANSQGEIDKLTTDLRQAHKDLGRSEQENLKLRSQLETSESQLQNSQERLQQFQERIESLEQHQEQLPVQLAYLEGQLDETRQNLAQSQQRVTNLEESVKGRENQLTRSQTLYNQAQDRLKECQKIQKNLEEKLGTKTAEPIQAQAELKAAKEAGRCPIAQMFPGWKKQTEQKDK